MSQPTQDPTWDSNATHTLATLSGHKTDGWITNEIPASDELNYWMMAVGAWINYLAGLLTRTYTFPATAIIGDTSTVAHNAAPLDTNYRLLLPIGIKVTAVRARTLAGIVLWGSATTYAVGNIVGNDSTRKYVCTHAGTSGSSGGPTGTGSGIADPGGSGGITWDYHGVQFTSGTGTLALEFRSSTDGTPSTIATSTTSMDSGVGETLTCGSLSTVITSGTYYYATIHDVGVSNSSSIFGFEVDATWP